MVWSITDDGNHDHATFYKSVAPRVSLMIPQFFVSSQVGDSHVHASNRPSSFHGVHHVRTESNVRLQRTRIAAGGRSKIGTGAGAADTTRVTPGGATFTVPSGWSIVTGKNLVILEPPEADTHVAIVDSPAADASAAVAAGWAAYKPDSKRPLKLVTPRPPREGWDERLTFDYETSPNERAVVHV